MKKCLQVSRKGRDENENSFQVNLVNLNPDLESLMLGESLLEYLKHHTIWKKISFPGIINLQFTRECNYNGNSTKGTCHFFQKHGL